jgi:prepilin-type N-terminal cleavage/methylation domain-containing protein
MIQKQNKNSLAFTLIELLVVVGIIGLLVAILVPTIGQARESAKSTQCMANLHSISQAMTAYISDYHGFFPPMSNFPTIEPPISPRKPIVLILSNYVGGQTKIFKCPADRFINPTSQTSEAPPANVQNWFEWQGASYQPMYGLSYEENGKWSFTRENSLSDFFQQVVDSPDELSNIPLLFDYEQFHPIDGESFAAGRMVLFADFHITKGKEFVFKMDDLK